MTREEIAEKIRWPFIIWAMGLVNVVAMLPQLFQIMATGETEGLNVSMFWLYFLIQVAFSLEGYFKRNAMLMWCLGLSAVVSATIIACIYYYRM